MSNPYQTRILWCGKLRIRVTRFATRQGESIFNAFTAGGNNYFHDTYHSHLNVQHIKRLVQESYKRNTRKRQFRLGKMR